MFESFRHFFHYAFKNRFYLFVFQNFCKTSSLKRLITYINWLNLELLFNILVIQTNRCFIKSRIRDLLYIRRFFIEILNDYRISLIHDLFVIFTTFELESVKFFWLHHYSTHISSLFTKIWASRFDNRLLVSDLNYCKSFIRFWFESLQVVYSFLIWIVTIFSFNEIETSWDLMLDESTIISNWESSFFSTTRLIAFSMLSKVISRTTMKKKRWKRERRSENERWKRERRFEDDLYIWESLSN